MCSVRHVVLLASAVALVAAAAGCGEEDASGGGSVDAVATTTQVADLVRAVGGNRVDVHQILDPNSDPHSYEPRPSDAAALSDADLIFRSGGDVDEWLGELTETAGGDAAATELIESVRTMAGGHDHEPGEEDHADEEGHADEDVDPHWWQDPRNAIRAVGTIEDALGEADPEGRERYRANAAAYVRELRRLDREIADCIERIPPAQRRLVTTHDALGYFADRYGIEVVGALIPSVSTAAQPSAGDIEDLVEQIRAQRVEAIFPESSLAPKLERAVARETGAAVGDALWADTLGPSGSSGETYVESIRSNTAALAEGLTGGRERCTPGR